MSESLAAVWQEVKNLLDQGINLIPVRDKDTVYRGKIYEAKTPYAEWKTYQYERIEEATLFDLMANRYDTTAIAMVCGAISGNLEVIDFDVKYKPGIDAVVLTAMKELYPDITEKMRVHKTRSGGTHLVYRIADHEVPGSCHLAERPATQEELDADISKNKRRSRCFIETRGTGGLATAPPSIGYTIRRNIPVQTITWEERCAIIEFCKAYNEFYPDEKPWVPNKSEQNYYDENPFEHYNRTVDPVELLTTYGWVYVRKHGKYIWFTRPGGRKGDVHAGFNTDACTYRVWGTKADLDSERSYTPSTILAHYEFGDDKSRTYAHLVERGYGRIKPGLERQIARRRAQSGAGMPTNASEQALQEYSQLLEQAQTMFPHGIYWEEDDEGKVIISRLKFITVASGLGFRLHEEEIVQIVDRFIYRRDMRFFYDTMRDYVKHDDPNIYEEIYNATQTFIEKHGKFEIFTLETLNVDSVLCDTRANCYKFYLNGYVHITPQGYELLEYEKIEEKLIWYEKIQQRNFNGLAIGHTSSSISDSRSTNGNPIGLYSDFLHKACNLNANRQHIMRVIGWLAHEYKDTAMAYIITLVEQCANPLQGGGSGKNLFCELLKYTTTYGSLAAGQKRNFDGTMLLQAWKGEKVYALSDVKKDFDFDMLKEPSSGKATEKKLFKDERNLDVKDVPKFIVLTNFSYEVTDGGLDRRIIAIEFTDFFTKAGGIDAHYGKMFPDDWGEQDWLDYDNFICASVLEWMRHGLKLGKVKLSATGWEKQFAQTYGITIYEFINEHWHNWKGKFISNTEFKKQLNDFLEERGIGPHDKYRPKMPRINAALDEWCKHFNVQYNKDATQRVALDVERGRKFDLEDAPF